MPRGWNITARLSDSVTTEAVTSVALDFGRTELGAQDGAIGVVGDDGSIEVLRFFGSAPPFEQREGVVALPLLAAGRVIGAVSFRFATGRAVNERIRRTMEVFCRQCAVALDRARLRVAAEEARRALDEAKSKKEEFLALLAHELRNPLAPIRTAAQILELRPSSDPAVERSREIIQRQVGYLARLIDDLLDTSTISLGKIRLDLDAVDLADLVREVADDHRALFDAARIELDVQAPDEEIWVLGDRVRLAQAIANLLSNAAKFTDAGGCVQALLTSSEDSVELRVRDTGIGIQPELLEHIFEPFAQGERRMDCRSAGGLGLGLALVRRLATLHGGSAKARSEGQHRGSEFVLCLPLDASRLGRARSVSPEAIVSRRVLLVEDNVDAAETLATYLEMVGHVVEVAHDGRAGLEVARRFSPDVVICDIDLPGRLDGHTVARRLRGFSDALLIALTGYGQEKDRARSREAGFDLHSTKPVDPKTIAELIGRERSSL